MIPRKVSYYAFFKGMAASKPTSLLSLVAHTFHPIALNQHLGTLTVGWVVPLSE